MAFDKHYPNRKDHRQQHRGAASFDRSCRNHGSCPWCHGNRTIATDRRVEHTADALMEVFGFRRVRVAEEKDPNGSALIPHYQNLNEGAVTTDA